MIPTFAEYFQTQKRCLTGLQLLSNILISAVTKLNGWNIIESAGKTIYRIKGSALRRIESPLMAISAISSTAQYAADDASHDPKKYREVRSILEESGLFKHHSGKSAEHESPPCRYSMLIVKEALKAFQWLYAQFFALQKEALERGNRVLVMPMHHFSTIRHLFKAVFTLACGTDHIDSELLNETVQSRAVEAWERLRKWRSHIKQRIDALTGEIDNLLTFGLDPSKARQELARVRMIY